MEHDLDVLDRRPERRAVDVDVSRDDREQAVALRPHQEPRVIESHGDAHEVALLVDDPDIERHRARRRIEAGVSRLEACRSRHDGR